MLNLAPIRYSGVLSENGGPIRRITYAERKLLGRPCTHAAAYLREDLVPSDAWEQTLTRQPDGAGSHESTQVACYMAVSEALERWALHACRTQGIERDYGFDVDPSSNGFAAYPGLFKRQARKAAFREAIERHCLICWWEGILGHRHLPDPEPGVCAISIDNPFSSHHVVLQWSVHRNYCSYSFGAGDNLNHALWRAFIELGRIQALLDQLHDRAKHSQSDERRGDIYERRIKYFSTPQGKAHFLNRLGNSVRRDAPPLKIHFDGPVPGPWSRYATVWRTVVQAESRQYLSQAEDYFFW